MDNRLIKTLMGYRIGFAYYKIGDDVFRCDYTDQNFESLRWYSTFAGMKVNVRAYGPLFNGIGEEAQPLSIKQ